jgi:hypothetical protein
MVNYANFVIETCPNLTTLDFSLIFSNMPYSNADYVDKVHTILSSLVNEFLKPLDKGHSELKICLTWFDYSQESEQVRKGWNGMMLMFQCIL